MIAVGIGLCCCVCAGAQTPTPNHEAPMSGNSVIRRQALGSEIVITTTDRLAGAIHSVVWNDKEFIDSFDHGRQLQSASNFDLGGRFVPETFNPTEAGSRRDARGPNSSSKLLFLAAADNQLQTLTQMAFWLRPGEKSQGHPAKNTTIVSNHLLYKHVVIGHAEMDNVLRYDVTFILPVGERHHLAQFEIVTGYMPPDFNRFYRFDPQSRAIEPLSDGPGEQADPVILATESGGHAMGVYSPSLPSPGYENAGYGRFRFKTERVNKWNCVARVRDRSGVPAGEYRFRSFVVIGSLEDVSRSMTRLHELYAE